MVDHERLVIAEVPVRQPLHQKAAERVKALRRNWLQDAPEATARFRERVDGEARRANERAVCGGRPVDVERPIVERVSDGTEPDHVFRRAGRRQLRPVEVGGQQRAELARCVEALLRCRLTLQHLRAVVCANLRTAEREERRVVGIRPDAELRVLHEFGPVAERVEVVRPGRVAGLRDGDALQVWRGRYRELRDHPAVRHRIVRNLRIAVAIDLAAAAEAGPQRVERERAKQHAACLVEDGETEVHRLDVVVRTDVAGGVRWHSGDGECAGGANKASPHPVEAERRRCDRGGAHGGATGIARCGGRGVAPRQQERCPHSQDQRPSEELCWYRAHDQGSLSCAGIRGDRRWVIVRQEAAGCTSQEMYNLTPFASGGHAGASPPRASSACARGRAADGE